MTCNIYTMYDYQKLQFLFLKNTKKQVNRLILNAIKCTFNLIFSKPLPLFCIV